MNILLIGGPGSGKGTLGKYLAESNGMHLSTGELFRMNMEFDTEIGKKVKDIINAGGLADDETTVEMMRSQIKLNQSELLERFEKYNLIFDGFPRTLEQGPMLDEMLFEFDRKLDVVFFLDVPDSILMKRMQERARVENRAGDSDPEYCRKRIEVYNSRTAPLLNLYKKRGILATIDGTKSIEEVREITSNILLSNLYDNFSNDNYGLKQK